ncbi:MAG: hypothetical protein H6837_20615 [Planctomycetes bacterium]|nr:hypothetical protein [Planctomycetota bacterium]
MRYPYLAFLAAIVLCGCTRKSIKLPAAPAWRVGSKAGEAIAELRTPEREVLAALWVKLPPGSSGASVRSSGDSVIRGGVGTAHYELAIGLHRTGLSTLDVIAWHDATAEPDDHGVTMLQIGAARFTLAPGNIFLVDARAAQPTVRRLSNTGRLSGLGRLPNASTDDVSGLDWLKKHVAGHPDIGDWR